MLTASDISSAAYQAHRARKARLKRKRVREPVNSYLPSISVADDLATIHAGGWTGAPVFAYQWMANGAYVDGATAETYEIQEGDLTVSCRVTATNDGGASVAFAPSVEV
jgi:hypothetical protein